MHIMESCSNQITTHNVCDNNCVYSLCITLGHLPTSAKEAKSDAIHGSDITLSTCIYMITDM